MLVQHTVVEPEAVHLDGQGLLVIVEGVVYLFFNGMQQCGGFHAGSPCWRACDRYRFFPCLFPLQGISRFLLPLAEDVPETLLSPFTGLDGRHLCLPNGILPAL